MEVILAFILGNVIFNTADRKRGIQYPVLFFVAFRVIYGNFYGRCHFFNGAGF